METLQTNAFLRAAKKLHKNEKKALDKAVRKIIAEPECGDLKVGDLAGVRVYKYKVQARQYLLGYRIDEATPSLTLLALGAHENFYKRLKHS